MPAILTGKDVVIKSQTGSGNKSIHCAFVGHSQFCLIDFRKNVSLCHSADSSNSADGTVSPTRNGSYRHRSCPNERSKGLDTLHTLSNRCSSARSTNLRSLSKSVDIVRSNRLFSVSRWFQSKSREETVKDH